METRALPDFLQLNEFASSSSGGKVLFATDDFFAPCENMIADSEPLFNAEKFTEFGKWMDGWETRRKRIPGHDWAIIKLASKTVISGLLVDTAHFTGNFVPKYSIQAAHLSDEEEALIPKRDAKMGTACTEEDLKMIKKINTDKWEEIVPRTALKPGYEETRKNYQKVLNSKAWTHIRVNIYPDGGIARLRVYGRANPETPHPKQLFDLASLLSGTVCVDFSNAHYGHPKNMIKPSKSECMADGWETARRLDRPEILEANIDGTLKVPGKEWAVFKLGFRGAIMQICVDTAHFKGNFPDSVEIEGLDEIGKPEWIILLKPSKLSAHEEKWFDCNTSAAVTQVKITMAPDGGISRIRLVGCVADPNKAAIENYVYQLI